MNTDGPGEHPIIDWGWAGAGLDGGESGDAHVVLPFHGGVLVGLVDGLGHGPEAATAAKATVALLRSHAPESLPSLVERCHAGLRKTRGVVISLAALRSRDSSLTWIGVGNVDAVLLRARRSAESRDEALTTRGGVVGFQLPPLRESTLSVSSGDTLIMATDGIRAGFSSGLAIHKGPQELAESILVRDARGTDDAHVLVARYVGGGALSHDIRARVVIRHDFDIVAARLRARELGLQQGLAEGAVVAMATAVTEVARNILVHAGTGEILLGVADDGGKRGVVVVALDEGPGIPDIARAMQDGYSTANGLGLGLPGAKRLMDEFDIVSLVGGGTEVTMRKWGQ
jgi:anti-sigma regulatory factor (Ser/Thr protein kinase)